MPITLVVRKVRNANYTLETAPEWRDHRILGSTGFPSHISPLHAVILTETLRKPARHIAVAASEQMHRRRKPGLEIVDHEISII